MTSRNLESNPFFFACAGLKDMLSCVHQSRTTATASPAPTEDEPMTKFSDGRLSRAEAAEEAVRFFKEKIENAAQAMSETHSSWEARCHAIMAALDLNFGEPSAAPECIWLPIDRADKTIVHVESFGNPGITLRNSERFWVRDDDGRTYEASWSESDNGRSYWWDWDGESPVDPVEFMPHPLDPRWHTPSQA